MTGRRARLAWRGLPALCFPVLCTEDDLPTADELDKMGFRFDLVFEEFETIRSVEDSPAATDEIELLMYTGLVRMSETYQECHDRLGRAVALRARPTREGQGRQDEEQAHPRLPPKTR